MNIMQGPDLLFWFVIEILLIVLSVLFTWYMVVIGRDTKPRRQRRGEEAIEHFPGGLEENRAPLPKFIVITIWGAVIWSLGYLIWTGFAGIGY